MSNTKDLSLFGSELTVGADDITLGKNVVTPEFSVNAFAKDITATAVDVFVYDTNKDSDGGAWRKRTQHTSWYNETLNTATRGSRREFPSVAVIVAEDDTVTIYDGDDPDLPMWMVFNSDAYTFIGPNDRTVTSVKMLNGILCIGQIDSVSFMSYVSFVDDSARAYSSAPSEYRDWLKPIADRNTTDPTLVSNVAYALIGDQIYDVAMTVLRTSPTDSATGLPIPTIAVATGSEVSIIKDDGTIVDITPGLNANVTANNINFYKEGIVFGSRNIGSVYYVGYNKIPTADTSAAPDFIYTNAAAGVTNPIRTLTYTGANDIIVDDDNVYVAHDDAGFTSFYRTATTHVATNQIRANYNTGWQPNESKLTTLSDTTSETVGIDESTNLVTNGTFDTDTTSWSVGDTNGANTTLASVSGELVVTADSLDGNGNWAQQSFTTVIGQRYTVSVDLIGSLNTSGVIVRVGGSSITVANGMIRNVSASVGTNTLDFVATDTTTYIAVGHQYTSSPSTSTWDNISVVQSAELAPIISASSIYEDNSIGNWQAAAGAVLTADNTYVNGGTRSLKADISADGQGAYFTFSAQAGQLYNISFDIYTETSTSTSGVQIEIGNVLDGSEVLDASFPTNGTNNTWTSLNYTFTAPNTEELYVFFREAGNDNNVDFWLDNVVLRIAERNWSAHAGVISTSGLTSGLQVHGQVTKSPVATGADLVKYEFPNYQDYLEQPYDAAYEFGAGDFSIIWWASTPSAGSDQPMWCLGDYATGMFALVLNSGGDGDELRVGTGGLTNTLIIDSHEGQGWLQFALVRSGSTVSLYKNGVLADSDTPVGSFTLAGQQRETLTIGSMYSAGELYTNTYSGDLALLRISASGLTQSQVQKIYEDEKMLFQENAQTTLYGSSDAVTALAYDEVTRQLHIGTSDGRSVFQGLRRVDNTTDAVDVAISAHNGLIAEE